MEEQENNIDYKNVMLDPEKMVEIPFALFMNLQNFIKHVVDKHTEFSVTDRVSWYSKETHEKLVKKGVKQDKLEADYYQNLDLEATKQALQSAKPMRDEYALFGMELQGEIFGVTKANIDMGNNIPTQPQEDTEQEALPKPTEDN